MVQEIFSDLQKAKKKKWLFSMRLKKEKTVEKKEVQKVLERVQEDVELCGDLQSFEEERGRLSPDNGRTDLIVPFKEQQASSRPSAHSELAIVLRIQ